MKAIVILFLSTLVLRESNSIAVSELVDIGYIAKDVVISLAKIWKLVDKNYDTFGNRFEGKLLRGVQNVNEKLNDLSERFEAQGTQTLMTVIQDLPHKMRLELKLNDLVDYLVRVHVIYRNMDRYLNSSDIEQHTLEDFAKSVTSHDPSSVMSLLERIHAFVVPIGAGLHSSDLINTLKELSEVSWMLRKSEIVFQAFHKKELSLSTLPRGFRCPTPRKPKADKAKTSVYAYNFI